LKAFEEEQTNLRTLQREKSGSLEDEEEQKDNLNETAQEGESNVLTLEIGHSKKPGI
jgi:hypothetical protein